MERLLKELRVRIEKNPAVLKDILDIIPPALESYENTIDHRRKSQACNALNSVLPFCLDSKMFNKMDGGMQIACLIDSMMYMFPEGKITGHSQGVIEVFHKFRKLCKENLIMDDTWLKHIKGVEYFEWMKKVIENER